jgi:AcrR family transcriptional regulator
VLGTVSDRKRDAIARAALTLFTSDGYERTSVEAIAAEAGVSKRTVYNHFGHKENLFLAVVRQTYEAMLARISEIIGHAQWDRDLPTALTACVTEVTRSIVRAPDRVMLGRLLMTEAPFFPDVIDLLYTREVTPIIAEPLEKLAASGRLAVLDGKQAAEHLAALTYWQVSARSLMGTLPLGEDETARLIASGVEVFLRAYAPSPAALPAHPPDAGRHTSPSSRESRAHLLAGISNLRYRLAYGRDWGGTGRPRARVARGDRIASWGSAGTAGHAGLPGDGAAQDGGGAVRPGP